MVLNEGIRFPLFTCALEKEKTCALRGLRIRRRCDWKLELNQLLLLRRRGGGGVRCHSQLMFSPRGLPIQQFREAEVTDLYWASGTVFPIIDIISTA